MLTAKPLSTRSSATPTIGIVVVARRAAFNPGIAEHDDHVDPLRDEFADQSRVPIVLPLGPEKEYAVFAVVVPAEFLHGTEKRFGEC
jgi:hypothetical protein